MSQAACRSSSLVVHKGMPGPVFDMLAAHSDKEKRASCFFEEENYKRKRKEPTE